MNAAVIEQVLDRAAALFHDLSGRTFYEDDASREVLAAVLTPMAPEDLGTYPDRLSAFAADHEERLRTMFRWYCPGGEMAAATTKW